MFSTSPAFSSFAVDDIDAARTFYSETLGLTVEFEVPDTRTVALNDGEGFAIFLQEKPGAASGIALWFQVDDVDATGANAACASARVRRRTSGVTALSSSTPTAT